jgi:tripartite-type tricarboxylate transporter receptor subunit TctC
MTNLVGRRRFLHLAAGAASLPTVPHLARAQAYPSRPVTLIVPFAAGGPNDAIARILADRMRTSLGQPFILENVDGGAGSIGAGKVARAAPDGYTICIGYWGTHVANPVLYSLDYDVVKDFEPISLIAESPLLIVARKTMAANSLPELIEWLKVHPDAIAPVPGSGSHVAAVFLQRETGVRLKLIPYRGAGPAIADLGAGKADMALLNAGGALPHVRTGVLKAYAVTARQRLAAAPAIPTADESGLAGFNATVWFGFWAPARTPKDIVVKLNAAIRDALADPSVRAKLDDLAQVIFPRDQQTPEALGALQKAEIEKWWPIITAAGIKGE